MVEESWANVAVGKRVCIGGFSATDVMVGVPGVAVAETSVVKEEGTSKPGEGVSASAKAADSSGLLT